MVNDFRPFGAAMAKLSTSTKTIERDDGSKVGLSASCTGVPSAKLLDSFSDKSDPRCGPAMPRYSLERLGSGRFEAMAQALLEPRRRGAGELIQFSPTADGGREATWEQPTSHPEFVRLSDVSEGTPHKWVFQVKYHDLGVRGWRGAADALISGLKDELIKLTQKHKVPCHRYVLITNVVLSGVRHVGTRDKISDLKQKYKKRIPSIEVWDATDVSRMLDNNEAVRTAYLDDLAPGDFLKAVLKRLDVSRDRKRSALAAYLRHTVEYLAGARAQEAGDEGELPLAKVYVDLSLRLDRTQGEASSPEMLELWNEVAHVRKAGVPSEDRISLSDTPASSALLFDNFPTSMILAGPGYGKSTVTQFLTLYHAARLVDPAVASELEKRLRIPTEMNSADIGSTVKVRVPFKVELRRFAKWHSGLSPEKQPGHLAEYIASQLINSNVSGSLTAEDIFEIAHDNPTLIVLDGLDEVPGKDDRERVMKAIDAFILRCQAEEGDIQLILSSRPQGYANEFEKYIPIKWSVRDLESALFGEYTQSWLRQRVRDASERQDAVTRLERGMKSPAVARLATTLLQATVMMTIVKRKSEVPHERYKLYHKYVDVIFEREREKWPLVSEYEDELRRLHELAGYELHKAVEAGQYKIIEASVFRGMVLRIWEQFRGAQPTSTPLTKTVDEIIGAAANRLVFLSGKGEEQSDIDFVIQSFREYFAAQYLANHADADQSRVLDMLVGRGFFWSNVLQFYIGLAKPAEQITWMHSASQASTGPASDVNKTVSLVQYRRSLMQCLPEFSKV
ncbi:NACHT domain-containing protein [Limnoglobus roseus]|uniref:NACHT domain-containing protein n=1 Tax=Limnoglobus roseus TaxID=2598579 RepID=UPI0011EAD82A|nr:hypothetical protein [Limnoglobus roseus]